MTTELPTPTLAGQSPGRGDGIPPGGGGGGGGGGEPPGAADDEPQAVSVEPIPMAAIVLNIAEPPTARPIDIRKSLRLRFAAICSP